MSTVVRSCGRNISEHAFVAFDVEYEQSIAGGAIGKQHSEIYPIRIDAHGTHQFAHATECRANTTYRIDFATSSHHFHVKIARHNSGSDNECLQLPYYRGGAYARLPDEVIAAASDVNSVSSAALVILHVYATTYSETAQQCWTHVGSAVVTASFIVSKANAGADVRERMEVWQNIDNSALGTDKLLKGYVTLTNFQAVGIEIRTVSQQSREQMVKRMHSVIQRGMLSFFAARDIAAQPASERGYYNSGTLFVNDTPRAAFLNRATKKCLSRFHCPTYATETALLPASAYAMMMPAGAANVAYFEGTVAVGLRRSGLVEAEALHLGGQALTFAGTEEERYAFASFAVRSACVGALSQCYLDDFINRNVGTRQWSSKLIEGAEHFQIARLLKAEDCEGLALEIKMHIRQLCRLNHDELSPLLQCVRQFFRLFVPTLMLGAVSLKKMTNEEMEQGLNNAHTFVALIPYRQFHAASKHEAQQGLEQSRFFAERRSEFARDDDWNPLIAEGTAPIDPAMRPVVSYYEEGSEREALALQAAEMRRELGCDILDVLHASDERNLVFEALNALLRPTAGEDYSTFYKYTSSFATAEFADRRTFDWTFVYNRDEDTKRATSVQFADFIDARASVGVLAHMDVTEEEAAIMDTILLEEQPIPVLEPAPRDYRSLEETRYTAVLDTLVRARKGAIGGTWLHRRQIFLTIRSQDITARTIQALRGVSALANVRWLEYQFVHLNAAVDGTEEHNVALDIYVGF